MSAGINIIFKNTNLLIKGICLCIILFYNKDRLFAQNQEFSKFNIMSFANHLYENGEYDRVIYELERSEYLYGENLKAGITADLCRIQLKERNDEYWKSKNDNNAVSKLFILMYYNNQFVAYDKNTNFNSSDDRLRQIYAEQLVYNYSFSNKLNLAKDTIDDYNLPNSNELFLIIESYENNLKTPVTAAMAGIIPGGGYYYSQNPKTAVVAFMVVAIFTGFSYYSYQQDNYYFAVSSGTIGALFYGGSILGGYLESKRYNRSIKNDMLYNLNYAFDIGSDYDYIYKNYGIGSDF